MNGQAKRGSEKLMEAWSASTEPSAATRKCFRVLYLCFMLVLLIFQMHRRFQKENSQTTAYRL